jgi:hypothetical protein
MSGFIEEFREFAIKGNAVDLAVGVIIGGAFGKIVDSVVGDLIMPIVSMFFGGLDFSNYFIPLSGQTATTRGQESGRRLRLRQFHHRPAQLPYPRLHHLPDGQAGEPSQA